MKPPSQDSKICKFNRPRRTTTNKERRAREYLTPDEVEKLKKVIRKSHRNAIRDEALVVMMYKHGLRVSEAIHLTWDHISFHQATVHVSRLKNGRNAVHPLAGETIRLLRRLWRQGDNGRFLFMSERKAIISPITVYRMVSKAGIRAGFDFPIHPHMLRHGCGYYLANRGTDTRTIQLYLGHVSIANTALYTELNARKFEGLWS